MNAPVGNHLSPVPTNDSALRLKQNHFEIIKPLMQHAVVSFILTFIFSVRSHEECHLMALYENSSDFVVFMVNFSFTVSVTRRAVFHKFLHLCAHKA